jgi:hypothetical protein
MPGKDDPITIGDFSKPVVERPAVPASPTETALRSAEARLDAEVKKDEEALQPLQTYADRLKEAGVDLAKAAKIVDEVLLKGFYAEDMPVTKTISVRLRTRSARDTKRIQELLEAERPTFDHHYRESMTRLLLAASLERFGNDKLGHPDKKTNAEDIEKMFQERISYVDNQVSDPALRILFQKLWKFDRMITIALEEGAIENF